MAHAAIGELFGVNVIVGDQFLAERELIRRVPVHVENFVARADVFFRMTMTFETPLHVKRVRFPRERHLIQLSVARGAADAVIDVNAVVEKNEIRRVVHAIPMQRFILRQAFADGREHRRIFPDLRMAGHAGFGRRHSGER